MTLYIFVELKELAGIPLALFYEACIKHNSLGDDPKKLKPIYRRIVMTAISGGIPIDLLSKLTDFVYKPAHFHSIGLPLLEKGPTLSSKDAEFNFDIMKEHFKSESKLFSEASLRVLFLDPLITSYFKEKGAPWEIVPELIMTKLMALDSERIVDMAIVCKRFNLPIVFAEVALDKIVDGPGHKDSSKIGATLSLSCNELAMALKKEGIDPAFARSFGLLVGEDKIQLAVCFPVITEVKPGVNEIHTIISMNNHWFLDFGSESNDKICLDHCCNSSGTLNPADGNFKVLNKAIDPRIFTNSVFSFDVVTATESAHSQAMNGDEDDDETMEPGTGSKKKKRFNKLSYSKLTAFFENTVKPYLRLLATIKGDRNDPNFDYELKEPSIACIPCATSGTDAATPFGKGIVIADNMELSEAKCKLSDRFKTGKSLEEMNLYKKQLYYYDVFPKLFDCSVLEKDFASCSFEKMLPLLGGGPFGPFAASCFCPGIVRGRNVDQLALDAATFSVHILYGMHVLHEKIGYVHGDISPSNVMFSPLDGIWKLNDFGASSPVDKPLRTDRKFGTCHYRAPESEKTKVYSKASDVYALSQVIMNTFLIQMMYLVEGATRGPNSEAVYEAFEGIVSDMANVDPVKRLSVIQAMAQMYSLIQNYPIKNFPIYGSDSIMLKVRYVLEDAGEIEAEAESFDNIPTNEIVAENPTILS